MSVTINLQGPSTGGLLITPVVVNAQVNAALATIDRLPARSLLRSWLPDANMTNVASATIYSLSSQWGLEAPYDLVRLVFYSPNATGFTIARAIIAPSSALGDGHTPVNAAGANDFTLFQPAYFNNGGADVSPQDQTTYGSGATSFAIPGNGGSTARFPLYFSDWMRVPSLARTDGGTTSLLVVRNLTDAAGTYRFPIIPAGTWAASAQGRTLSTFLQSGDYVTVPASLPGPSAGAQLGTPGVQYIARNLGFSVLGIGDSLTQGYGSTTNYHSWGYLSCLALSTPARPISFWNQGFQGQASVDFWANGYNAFKACKPDVATIATWTPNDPHTQAAADLAWSRALDLAQYVLSQGRVPVLTGPLPYGTVAAGAEETARLSTRTRMLNAGAQGMAVLDWESLGTGANPNVLPAGLLATGGQANHPNDAGNALMDTAVFRPVLANILRV